MTDLLVIAGPTAAGKSDLAVKVAQSLDGEIISADSVQVYRYFNIGSAKPEPEMRMKVAHHLIDIVDPDEPFTMWDYNLAARKAIEDITSRGKLPIIVGGSGLYIKAVLENLSGGVKSDPKTRETFLKEIKKGELGALYKKLQRLDPEKAAGTQPSDRHRIIRGLESVLLPQKEEQEEKEQPSYNHTFFVLAGKREKIYERIENRVSKMLKNGWIGEVEAILEMGHFASIKPFQSVGYKQILQFLAEGKGKEYLVPRSIVIHQLLMPQIQKATRNYAKRQITWFNRVEGAIWLDAFGDGGLDGAAEFIAGYLKGLKSEVTT